MLSEPTIGMQVTITWGHCKGKTGTIIGFSATQRNMVVVEYLARLQDRRNGALPGEPVRVYLHRKHLEIPKGPIGIA